MDINSALKNTRRVHFIGIGGAGMSPLAEILLGRGYEITGSDNNESETLERIRAKNISVFMGHSPENISGAEMIIHTAAIMEDNVELLAAKNSGIPVFERSKLLGAISKEFGECICISGTHGKTTVTSMAVQIAIGAGLDPSAVIGGKLPLINSNAAIGKSELFICEACEFAETFLELAPSCSVILNIDEDHLDCYGTMENLIKAFTKFASLATDSIIYNGDDSNTLKALEAIGTKKLISFGLNSSNDWSAANFSINNRACYSFDIIHKGGFAGRAELNVPGEHNVMNALAAIAVSVYAGASAGDCIRGLADFTGAGRRFEIFGEWNGIGIADDYAHHPAELNVTLEAAKKMDYKRVIAVFQPFTYSRTRNMLDEFAQALSIADIVVMTEIMGAREKNTFNVYTSQLAEKIPGSAWFNTFEEVADYTLSLAREGDLVITLGCGDIYKAAKIMIDKLSRNTAGQ